MLSCLRVLLWVVCSGSLPVISSAQRTPVPAPQQLAHFQRCLATSDSLQRSAPRKALGWAREARRLAPSLGGAEYLSQAHERLGRAYLELYELDTAMSHADSARVAAALQEEGPELERAEQLLGEVHLRVGDLVAAVEHLETALNHATRRNDTKAMTTVRLRLAYAHYVGHQPAVTYAHLDTCNRIFRAAGDHAGLAASYNRRAIMMAEDDAVNSLPLAKKYADTARYWAVLARDTSELARMHINAALMLMNVEDTVPALAHTDTAMQLTRALQDSFLLVHAFENLGQIHIRTNQPERACAECQVMLDYGTRHGIVRLQRDAWNCIMNAKRQAGEWMAAYEAYGRYVELNEGMVNVTARERILNRSLQMESGRRLAAMAEAHEAKLQNDRLWGLVVVVALIGVGAFVIMRQRGKVQQERSMALRLRIDQHFVGNAMASLSGFVLKEERERAYDALVRYDRFIRNTLDHSASELITLRQEMEALANYLAIEQALSGDAFSFGIDQAADLDPELVLIPPMLVQPWVENAVKHGVKALRGGGRIDVRFSKEANMLVAVVQDNGPGLHGERVSGTGGSWGARLTGWRLALLGRRFGRGASYRYEPVDRGTRLVLRIPAVHRR